ncbi:ATP-binding cassette [Lithospermum erythrorhizon]|uniref:ATP-binding cassette n=1 Tax=Lithospermum erythrorhizon TaxID=34254 RepID=A0AAV3S0R8_LITER
MAANIENLSLFWGWNHQRPCLHSYYILFFGHPCRVMTLRLSDGNLVSQDLSIVDHDQFAYANLAVLAIVTWKVLFVSIPMVYLSIRLQRYYFASAKEFMRINGTTKSFVTNHLAETVAGVIS